MGTTAQKLSYLKETKEQIMEKVNNIDGTITDNTTFRQGTQKVVDVYNYYNNDSETLTPQQTTGKANYLKETKRLYKDAINLFTRKLPGEYQQVEYIESARTQHIDTGINADYRLSVFAEMAILSDGAMGAIYNDGSSSYIRHHFNYNVSQGIRYYYKAVDGDFIQLIAPSDVDTNKHTYLVDIYNNIKQIDESSPESIRTRDSFDTQLNYWLFKRNSNVDSLKLNLPIKLYKFKMYYENVLVRDFIPCYRKADNEIGLYDIVNNVFYANEGTGTFEKGNDIITIDDNITNQTTFREYTEALDDIYNNLPKVEMEGNDFQVQDTKAGKVLLTPKGNVEQEKTNGYQCIAYPFVETTKTVNGLTFTDLGDGTVKVNGTSTANTDFILNTYNFVQGETYTIIDELTDNNYGKYTIMIPSYTSWGRNIYIGLNDRKYETFQADTSLQLRTQITIYANNTLNNVIFKPMLYKGSYDSSKEWEKYTNEKESPSPDYMQNIKVVTGTNVIKIGVINLIDKDNEIRQGGTVSTSDLTRLSISANIKLKANTTYALATNLDLTKFYYAFVLGSTKAPWNVQQQLYDSGWITNTNQFSYLITQDCYINIPIRKIDNSNITIDDVKDYWFMLYEGNYDANIEYEPYIEPIEKEFNLGNIELAKINDYSDLIFKNEITNPYYDSNLIENAWYKKEKIAKRILDGSEGWQQGNPYSRFFITTEAKVQDIEPISNYFKGYKGSMPANTNGLLLQQINDNTVRINLFNLNYENDLTGFVNWLENNNTIIYYAKDSSTYSNIQITDTTLISQLEEINSIIGQGGTVVIETESEEENAQLIVNAKALQKVGD